MNMILHKVNGLHIQQSRENGYINATSMCAAYNKDVSDWLKTDSAFDLVKALAEKLQVKPVQIKVLKNGNSTFTKVTATYPTLVIEKLGLPENGGGTWVHYKLAIPLAMWISPDFALLVSDWVEYWLTANQSPTQHKTSPEISHAAKAYIESSQALNRTIHTAIHQQTNSLREALKFLELDENVSPIVSELESECVEQILSTTNIVCVEQIKLPLSQPRRYFDQQKLEELARSIKEFGILEPLLVRSLSEGNYELVVGERRLRASQLAELKQVPVLVREMDDATARACRLIENLQREDLNPLEETEGILELLAIRLSITQKETIKLLRKMDNEVKGKIIKNVINSSQAQIVKELFDNLGLMKWDSFVNNRLALLRLPADVLNALREGSLEYTKAKAIAVVKDEGQRAQVLEEAIKNNLSLSQIKELIKQSQSSEAVEIAAPSLKQEYKELSKQLGTSKIWDDPKKKKTLEKLLSQIKLLLSPEN